MSGIALHLLAEARRYGVRLVPTPVGTIKASAPAPPPSEFLAKLKAHRADLLAALAKADIDTFEERPAIAEYDAGTPRAWAEGFARLDPDRPFGDVPLKRWRRFVDDCGRFLDSGWATRSAALGWHPLDLFGCDRLRPFARIDKAGLLWLLNGGKLIALSANTARIEIAGAPAQIYRRRPIEPGGVTLAWELDRGSRSPNVFGKSEEGESG